jgi:hypothetical protein
VFFRDRLAKRWGFHVRDTEVARLIAALMNWVFCHVVAGGLRNLRLATGTGFAAVRSVEGHAIRKAAVDERPDGDPSPPLSVIPASIG